jgi:tetrapyrrole methylase family protein/MazG family protein
MSKSITIVGLGSGDESKLTLGVWNTLKTAECLYLRTEDHPVVRFMKSEGVRYESFDGIYETHDTFEATYEAIVEAVLTSYASSVVYAVPGHPMVAEATVRMLLDRCQAEGTEVNVIGGESFLDEVFLRLGLDPIEGFQLIDAADLNPVYLRPDMHTIIAQVYDRYTASDVKLALMEVYPDEYPVVVAHALGVQEAEQILTVPLFELDRHDYGNLSLIWLPRSKDEQLLQRRFERLHEIVHILRSPGGCPWDREQTHQSIRKNLIEETYEVLETIDDDDPEAMCEELGDLLMQVLLHAQMEEEAGVFSVWDVIAGLNEKLIRRHPHVFGDRGAEDADQALATWQEMKAEEKRLKGITEKKQSQLDGIPRELPAMMYAYKLQKKASEVGFDWDHIEDVLAKVEEEINEVKAHLHSADNQERMELLRGELGDLIFAVVNAARFLKVDPEEALALTNRKFTKRFHHIESRLRDAGKSFSDSNLEEMDGWWEEAKKLPTRE